MEGADRRRVDWWLVLCATLGLALSAAVVITIDQDEARASATYVAPTPTPDGAVFAAVPASHPHG
jgi:hypothetical protein